MSLFSLRRLAVLLLVGLGFLVGLLFLSSPSQAGTFCNQPAPTFCTPAQIDELIAAMTLDEKQAALIESSNGVPRLGIPHLSMTDGPAGSTDIGGNGKPTVLPSPEMLTATFSPSLAAEYGGVLGNESQALGKDVIWAPMVNYVRVPQAGRNFETLGGEDPFLQSVLTGPLTAAIKNAGVIPTVKHFALNNQEVARRQVNVNADDRTLHEKEVPGFEAAIKAGAASVMCAYNKVGEIYSCENPLLGSVLRDELGFDGYVISDSSANFSTVSALNAGLDMELGTTRRLADPNTGVKAQVLAGNLPESVVDRSLRRIFTTMNRYGHLGNANPAGGTAVDHPGPPIDHAAGDATAEKVASAGATLLKNEGNTLPLTANDRKPLAVIGPNAQSPLISGAGSSVVAVDDLNAVKSPLNELNNKLGPGEQVNFSTGIDLQGEAVPTSALTPPGGSAGTGLLRIEQPAGIRTIDPQVDHTGDNALPSAPGTRWVWVGTITAPTTGDYNIRLQTKGGGSSSVFGVALLSLDVDGNGSFSDINETVFSLTGESFPGTIQFDGFRNWGRTIHMDAGKPLRIQILAGGGVDPLQIRLVWTTPQLRQQRLNEAVATAAAAKAAVVFAYNQSSEEVELPIDLLDHQNDLIQAVAAVQPKTIVVLNNGNPPSMPWIDQVGAVLEMWYPGQRGGTVTADVLLGNVNPSGKTPVTFPKRIEDSPTFSADGRLYPGLPNNSPTEVFYDEGIFSGYWGFDHNNTTPLFPFGHGLSYTKFRYSGLSVTKAGDGLDVKFTVQNTGKRSGAEVPQVYIGPPTSPPVPLPEKKLVGFDRVDLAPNESRTLTIHVGSRPLSYWNSSSPNVDKWTRLPDNTRPVYVGSSSRDIRLQTTVK